MRLEIGNNVAVLDDVLKGKVIAISGDEIAIQTADGMVFKFDSRELVKIEFEQKELSKFSDINNPLLREKSQEKSTKKTLFKKEKNEILLEVDLHINQLVKTTKNMDNYDMLNTQLDTAKRKVEYALSKKISKVIFIHGVGQGVLKSELHRLLSRYPVKFYDASYKKYGLGATEVYVYQNSN
ncbi:Smr/MutS family protein [Polaribacter aquimarinus]|uniref:DNA mismatch repair protein MutS n=1 Tax=Polaribacter aquimarinus TaxID=2100726 RepID=A0A2U2J9H6_9FLAO|nr:Smr/MutS family protein [Polaribacter aquimarinus]PWG04987.1 DNA mismatch repair protein MutS [Polaribacter aquimarinus]